MDRLALAAANALVGNEPFAAAIEIGPFGAAFTARGGAVRVALAGAARNADIAGRAVAVDTSMTLADGETLTLGFARGGSFSYLAIEGGISGRADVRQPRGECARRPRQSLSAPAAGWRRAGDGARKRRGRAPDRTVRDRRMPDPRRAGSAGRRIRRRDQKAVSRQRMEDIGDQRPHGLPARRSGHQASARPQHRLRWHRERQHSGARQRRSRSC